MTTPARQVKVQPDGGRSGAARQKPLPQAAKKLLAHRAMSAERHARMARATRVVCLRSRRRRLRSAAMRASGDRFLPPAV
jgi:hypothetical protein